jgi:hypothetical protein
VKAYEEKRRQLACLEWHGLSLWAGCAAQGDLAGARQTSRGAGGEVEERPTERSCLVAANFLEQIRTAQQAAKTKPETGPRSLPTR